MDYDVWINKALISIGALERESTFVLKDLFPGIEWNKLRTGEKKSSWKTVQKGHRKQQNPHYYSR